MHLTVPTLLLLLTAAPLATQTERDLRDYFEGRTVRLKIEMPGTQQGVDLYPGTARPLDFPRHASRLKEYGTAIRRGDEALVTKVKVKDDLIEFQLGGGGYGTFGDDDSPTVSVPSAPKTTREKNLEKELDRTTDKARRKEIREELDDLKRDRERQDAHNQVLAAQAQESRAANIRQRRLEGGSRFNLRFVNGVPRDALTPEAMMQALDAYVDFAGLQPGTPAAEPARELRKGLTVQEVDAMLGRPDAVSERREGSLTVSSSTYRQRDRVVMAEFVEGVLIRYTITSP
jgi:hypothetical protein